MRGRLGERLKGKKWKGKKVFWGGGEREPLMNTHETLMRNSAPRDS